MNGNEEVHQRITELMRQQAIGGTEEHSSLAAEHSPEALPLRTSYVAEETGRLVVGIDVEAESDRAAHQRALRSLGGGSDIEVRYVQVLRDACPDKKQDCRPLRGGVRMNGDATLNLVITQNAGGQMLMQTIASSHAVHAGTGQKVGQAGLSSPHGEVTVNPSLVNRASDAALTNISNRRTEASPYAIWRGSGVADYIVNDFAISNNTPEGTVVYLQGAMQPDLSRGRIEEKNVTIKDKYGTLTNQVYATYTADSGDSGGPVFYLTEYDHYVVYVGIHAGRVVDGDRTIAYYSPWEGIRADLGLDPVR